MVVTQNFRAFSRCSAPLATPWTILAILLVSVTANIPRFFELKTQQVTKLLCNGTASEQVTYLE